MPDEGTAHCIDKVLGASAVRMGRAQVFLAEAQRVAVVHESFIKSAAHLVGTRETEVYLRRRQGFGTKELVPDVAGELELAKGIGIAPQHSEKESQIIVAIGRANVTHA